VVQAPIVTRKLKPLLRKAGALPNDVGEPETLLADTGYFGAVNVNACESAEIDPLIAMDRQRQDKEWRCGMLAVPDQECHRELTLLHADRILQSDVSRGPGLSSLTVSGWNL
jgi:hypothetical protein